MGRNLTELDAPKEIRIAWRRFNRVTINTDRWRNAGLFAGGVAGVYLLVFGGGWPFWLMAAISVTISITTAVQVRMSHSALTKLSAYYTARSAAEAVESPEPE